MKRTDNAEFVVLADCPMCGTKHYLRDFNVREDGIITRCKYCSREFKWTKSSLIRSLRSWKAVLKGLTANGKGS